MWKWIGISTLSILLLPGLGIAIFFDNPKVVEERMSLHKDILFFYKKSDGNPDYFRQYLADLNSRTAVSYDKYGPNLPYGSRLYYSSFNETAIHRIAYSRSYDSKKYFEKPFDTPLFYAFGEFDVNVPTDASVATLEKIMKRQAHNIQYKVCQNVDHKMIKPAYVFHGLYPKGFLEEMVDWSRQQINNKK